MDEIIHCATSSVRRDRRTLCGLFISDTHELTDEVGRVVYERWYLHPKVRQDLHLAKYSHPYTCTACVFLLFQEKAEDSDR